MIMIFSFLLMYIYLFDQISYTIGKSTLQTIVIRETLFAKKYTTWLKLLSKNYVTLHKLFSQKVWKRMHAYVQDSWHVLLRLSKWPIFEIYI